MYHSDQSLIVESNVSDAGIISPEFRFHFQQKVPFNKKIVRILFRCRMIVVLLQMAFNRYGINKKAIQKVKSVMLLALRIRGKLPVGSMRIKNGNVSGTLYVPAFPSRAYRRMIKQEFIRADDEWDPSSLLQSVFIAITKKCPLNCEHCFEWDNLNQKEKLSFENLDDLISKFILAGVTKVFLSGGEPMLRCDDMAKLIAKHKEKVSFWVLTSGFNCNHETLGKLHKSGLTGIVVSIDHYDPLKHDRFRGFSGSFQKAISALEIAGELGLFTAMSVCCVREFLCDEYLYKITELGAALHVDFIQFLEPKQTGRYKNQQVLLDDDEIALLEKFVNKLAADPELWRYPRPMYHGSYQRKYGCVSSGVRSLYIDTDGDYHACPFSGLKRGNALQEDVLSIVKNLRSTGCKSFKGFISN